jgi:predicted nucleic acid-binding protein
VFNYPTPIFRIFLDTEVFVKANFNYQNSSFKKLVDLVNDGELVLYLTTVTYQEILSNIEQEVNNSDSSLKTLHKEFRKKAKIFYNHHILKSLFSLKYNKDDICQELKNQFLDYLETTESQIISVDKVSPKDIFDKYFNNLPPFKQGKKKNEFPDAFAIAALEKEAMDNNFKVYVISQDNDWQTACEGNNNLICLENVEKFLEQQIIIATKYKDINLYYEFLDNNFEQFKQKISDNFEELEFSLSGGYDFASWGNEEIEVTVESVKLKDKTLVEIDDETMTFELNVIVSFLANVSYDSFEVAVFDKEDDRYYNVETKEEEVHQNIIIPIQVHISYLIDTSGELLLDEFIDVYLDPYNSISTIEIDSGFYDDYH